ncbi:paclitaxel taxanoid biosynthesis susceptibility protein ts1 [Agrilactobacillus composti DSM 18527 = JCM 14202]|uniref:Paclitaxel taxanoid biosynthesis susceptibility protein ts1 n=1 Tax=Agrilactobacillus composti DSM 18527 = JCM 14202 TaxID=1423734 RepID=X0QL13_9LACO|nr:RNA-guided endonuclease IscB [Agrilactobacillus composti]KRM34987.1 paclitaxel taxanoid biosynthesis susceptibility protein ts1 [Agrilactobacillus composti DSM 18527 = JCM 14202]GAF39320.1 paclitaxel/taxanoid biosynthesis susceptibility protein TS1 [Agrilactobacillus composti DSM 18527 = JCM 14202]
MQNRVFVINRQGEPLMPCKQQKCRKLLQGGRAKVIKKEPFTIQLLFGSTGYKQPISIGVDSGQHHIGLAVTSQDKVLFQGEVSLRQDVKKLLDTRRSYRRGRRNRNTRYRPPRFLNRAKPAGWLPPSVANKVQHNINWIQRIQAVLPKAELHIEVGKFDMAKMVQPGITGLGYQQGDLYGYETTKQYVLDRDNYTCQICRGKNKDPKLKIHHIIYRSNGGTNQVSNLLTVCASCHTQANHQPGGKLFVLQAKKFQSHRSLKGATFMNILRRRLFTAFPEAKFQYGAQTTLDRAKLDLPKAHYNDAVTISGIQKIAQRPTAVVMFHQFRKKKRSLHEATARKGRKTPNRASKRNAKNTKAVSGFHLNDYVQLPDGQKGNISGFSGKTKCFVKAGDGHYLAISSKYKHISLSKLKVIRHQNNWNVTEIKAMTYEMA